MYILLIFSFIIFMNCLYYITTTYVQEGFENNCPNLLIQKNNMLYLFNKFRPEIPGINPVIFNNLNEYTEYIEFQRSQGKRCPVLHLRHIEDTQGSSSYKLMSVALSDPANVDQLLVSASHNKGSMPGYDPTGMNMGVQTPLDNMFNSREETSANAMDRNWGGVDFSRNKVKTGFYDDNEIYRIR